MGINGINSNNNHYNRTNNGYYNFVPQNSYNNSPIFAGSNNSFIGDSFNNTQTKTTKDGIDDGSIGLSGAFKNLFKGVGNFFKGMVCDENGKFSITRTLTTLGIGAAIGVACTMLPAITIAGTAFSTLGLISAGFLGFAGLHAGSSALEILNANTDKEAEQAWQNLGSALTEGSLAYLGYRASGGIFAKDITPTVSSSTTSKTQNSAPKTNSSEVVTEKAPMTMTEEARVQYNKTKSQIENSRPKVNAETINEQFAKPKELTELREYYKAEEKKAKGSKGKNDDSAMFEELESMLDAETFARVKRVHQLFKDAIEGKENALECIEKELGIKISNIKTDNDAVTCTIEYAKNDVGVVFKDVENVIFDDKNSTLNLSTAKWNKTSVEALTKSIDSLINSLEDGGQRQLYTARRNQLVESLDSYLEKGSFDSFDSIRIQEKIYKMECFMRDIQSSLTRKVSKLDKPHTKEFKFNDEVLNLEVQYTEVIKLPNGVNVVKYYNCEGELVAVVEKSGKFDSINPIDILKNTDNGTKIKLYNQKGFHQLDFAYYEAENGEFILKEGIYQGDAINNKGNCSRGLPNYLRIQLGKVESNKLHQNLFDRLTDKKTNHPIKEFLEEFYKKHDGDISNVSYKDICSAIRDFLNENPQIVDELKEAAGTGKLVINFGKGKDGELYFGINGTKTEGLDAVVSVIGERQNVFQGKCAENVLFAQAGENLSGQVVFDMHFFRKSGEFYVGQCPPCSTCYSEVTSHQWQHPTYMANRSAMRIKQ